MNPEIKAKWIQALRSGEYQQGMMSLRIADRFCCLGVLCDLHSKETDQGWVNDAYLGEESFIPDRVARWAGVACRPLINGEKDIALHHYNDGCGVPKKSFPEIADLIEAHL